MSLPLYFVQEADAPAFGGRVAGCGWHCGPEGNLRSPAAGRVQALVLDDRNPLPEQFDGLLEALLAQAAAVACEVIVLDFERPAAEAAGRFVRALSRRHRVAAPRSFCRGGCEPIVCYRPSRQTFSEFTALLEKPCWAELRPVDETVSFPSEHPPAGEGEFFSEVLQCHYTARRGDASLDLHFFDTAESFRRRLSLLAPRLSAAIGLRDELRAFGITESEI